MKKIILPAFVLLSIISCNSEQPDKDISVMPKNAQGVSADAPGIQSVTTTGSNLTSNLPGTEVQTTPVSQPNNIVQKTGVMPSQIVSAAKPAAGLNPAHGQPGHRCDISPGAPLSTPATKPQIPAATVSQPTIISEQKIASANPGVSVNPPHGQPGHKCDVGANNNLSTSGPKAPQTAPSLQGLPVMQQNKTITPTVIPTGSTGKLNPAHGQPGHDCKVSVGQPLK